MNSHDLTERERNILRFVVKQFILTAQPVGSRNITKQYDIGLSPASVRNIMSDLEQMGYIGHPHTSAGRVPTDKGYRLYVDSLMESHSLHSIEKESIHRQLENFRTDTDDFMNIASKILSNVTQLLACVVYPNYETGILEKLQIITLSSTKILVVISINDGPVKTITFEMESEVKESQIHTLQSILNEKLGGLSLSEIKATFNKRFADADSETKNLLNVVYKAVSKILEDIDTRDKIAISGAKNLIRQPEFDQPAKIESIVELIEDKDVIIHLFQNSIPRASNGVNVTIGHELDRENLENYSFVLKEYNIGNFKGSLGVVGPKRMEYNKIVAVVDYTAKLLTELLTKNS